MWSKSDLIFLKNNFHITSDIDLSNHLGKTIKSVQSKARRMGLKKEDSYIKNINKIRVEKRWDSLLWSKSDIDFLVNNINIFSNNQLAEKLGRTINSIISMCIRLGIKRENKYNKDFLRSECLKYITKQELRISDPNLYAWLYKSGNMTEFSSHMMNIAYSTPQLILKFIMSKLTSCKFNYNDRVAIKPYELDLFFPDINFAIEYDGIYYHKDGSNFKSKICRDKGIDLITIDENNLERKNFEGYLSNIKNELVKNIKILNEKLGIEESDISSIYISDKKDVFKGIFDIHKLKNICLKYNNYSDFIRNERGCYNKLYYMGILDDFTNHMRVSDNGEVKEGNKFKKSNSLQYLIDKKNYYNIGDIVLIEYWYNGMITCVLITDIQGRSYKISHNIPESQIFNAPDEIIKSSDIIDHFSRPKN